MHSRGLLGRRGEDAALEYLQRCGMQLLWRNWHAGHLEIDLVMEDVSSIRIVEVKSLQVADGFDPSENVTPDKRRKLISAAKAFYAAHPTHKEIRFDVVTVLFEGDTVLEVNYIPDAFDALG